jgi:putative ABC transport system permease protein
LFSTVSKAYDDSALRLPITTARELLRISGSHVWVLLLDKTEDTQSVLASLRSRFPEKSLEFVPWSDLADFYNKTVVLFRKQVGVIETIIAIIILLSIANTLMMNVVERTGEIGTAMALGVTRATIMRLFVLEGMLLGVVGCALGLVVGSIAAYFISMIGIPMPPPPGMARGYISEILLTSNLLLSASLLTTVTTLLASLYPAWRASRMVIVDALRFNR